MRRHIVRVVETLSSTAVLATIAAQPVAAVHEIVGCSGQSELEPIYLLIHQVVLLLFGIGGALAVAALVYAGVAIMWGSEDAIRRAIQRVQRVLMGVGLIFTAPFVITFLLIPLDPCTGGV